MNDICSCEKSCLFNLDNNLNKKNKKYRNLIYLKYISLKKNNILT